MTIDPPTPVLEIAARLAREGFDTWCVGGAVRDALLGWPHLDWDLATAATPDQVRAIFGSRRTIPVGVQFGTVGVLDRTGAMHEVTTFRRDVSTDGRHAVVALGATIDEDLARRDFTINALAYHPATGELRDRFGGLDDLARGVIRAVGEPRERMREDRLRALRALRFAGRLGFDLDPATWDAIVESAPHLTRLSAERVKQEIEKTLEQVARPASAFERWQASGALAVLVPHLAGVTARELAVLDCLPVPRAGGRPFRRILRLAALFGAVAGAPVAERMAALRFSKAESSAAAGIAERASRLEPLMTASLGAGRAPSDAAIRQWVAIAGRVQVPTVVRLIAARWSATRAGSDSAAPAPRAAARIYRRMLVSAYRDPVELADLAVDGDDLRRAGIPAGPVLGKILQALLGRVLEDPARNVPGTLLAIARQLHDEGPGSDPDPQGRTTMHGS